MRRKGIVLSIAASIGLMLLAAASAMDTKVGDLTITKQIIRATVPTAKVAAGYLTITNNGAEPDVLLGGNADFAGKVEIHEMKMTDGVMKMRPLTEGLVIAPGATVTLKPGAEHVMFMQLKEPMNEGDNHSVTLRFEKAGELELRFPVGDRSGAHSGHTH